MLTQSALATNWFVIRSIGKQLKFLSLERKASDNQVAVLSQGQTVDLFIALSLSHNLCSPSTPRQT